MKLLRDKKSIIFIAVCLVLVAALIAVSIVSVKLNKNLSDKKKELASAKKSISSYSSKIEEHKKTESEMQSNNDSLMQENEGLRAQLVAKKQAAEKAALEAKKKREAAAALSAERTQSIIDALSRPKQEQQAALPNVCYLTFDDGPSDNTLAILNILNTYHINATFFVVGTGKLEYLPQIVASGNAVGLHANYHDYNRIYASDEAYLTDLKGISDKVASILGYAPQIVRFPGGSSNKVSQICPGLMTRLTSLVPNMGYSYFDWNVSSGDAEGNNVNPNKLYNNVIAGAIGKTSICVLMHDTLNKGTTVEALPRIIEGLYSLGFRFEVITPQTYGYHHSRLNN